ncbi:MAG TPA: DoxX family protein [Burkholderiales bacterium]|nr:DoxX family protein [Burkholderiales bacterium]
MRQRFVALAERAIGWLGWPSHLLALAIRLHVANVFWKSGLTKIDDWDKTVFLFQEEYHVPLLPPELAAALGTFGELFFPVLLVLGLATRFAAASLFVVNVVAVVSYWHALGGNEAALSGHFYWGALLLVLLAYGPGKLSLDYPLWRWLRRPPG